MIAGKRFLIVLAVLVCMMSLSGCQSFKEKDAKEVVQATLDLMMQGDAEGAVGILDGSKEDFVEQYLDDIAFFLDSNIVGGLNMDGSHYLMYQRLAEEIFRTSKYRVMEATKESSKLFWVEVAIQPSDIFRNAVPKIQETSARIEQQAADGHYGGNEQDVKDQMLYEFLRDVYDVLENAYYTASFEEEVVVKVPVTKNENGSLEIAQNEQFLLLEKILGMDRM